MTRGNYVYATTATKAGGPEFFIIDISIPSSPRVVSSLEINADVNEVSTLLDVAYIATSDNNEELIAIDVSDPADPQELGSYNAPGNTDGRSVHAKTAKRIYLGRSYSTSDHEFFILDATAFPITRRGSTDISGGVFSLITAGTLSFLGTDKSNEEFQNFNIKNPLLITQVSSLDLSNLGTGADYYDNIVYMSVNNVDILKLISTTAFGFCV